MQGQGQLSDRAKAARRKADVHVRLRSDSDCRAITSIARVSAPDAEGDRASASPSGESDDLILQSFVQEYGEKVLAEPPAHGFNSIGLGHSGHCVCGRAGAGCAGDSHVAPTGAAGACASFRAGDFGRDCWNARAGKPTARRTTDMLLADRHPGWSRRAGADGLRRAHRGGADLRLFHSSPTRRFRAAPLAARSIDGAPRHHLRQSARPEIRVPHRKICRGRLRADEANSRNRSGAGAGGNRNHHRQCGAIAAVGRSRCAEPERLPLRAETIRDRLEIYALLHAIF